MLGLKERLNGSCLEQLLFPCFSFSIQPLQSPTPTSLPCPAMLAGDGGGCWGSGVAPCSRSVLERTEKWPKARPCTRIKPQHGCPATSPSPGGWPSRVAEPSISGGCSPSLTLLPPRLLGASTTASSNGFGQMPSCSRAVFPICKAGRNVLPSLWEKPFALGHKSRAMFASLIQEIFALRAPSRDWSSA